MNGNRASRGGEQVRPVGEIFRVPLALAAVSGVGLASALLGDGVWDALSWVALGIPVVAALWYSRRRVNGSQG